MAVGDLTDLASVKAHLRVKTTEDDALLARLISDASAYIPQVIQRGVALATYSELYTGNGKDRQLLRNSPIQSVISVAWIGTTIMTPGDPITGTAGFYIEDEMRLRLTGGYTFPLGSPVRITYTAGWPDGQIPLDIVETCIELVAESYRRREHIGEASHVQGNGMQVSYDMKLHHNLVSQKLQNYTRVAPL